MEEEEMKENKTERPLTARELLAYNATAIRLRHKIQWTPEMRNEFREAAQMAVSELLFQKDRIERSIKKLRDL